MTRPLPPLRRATAGALAAVLAALACNGKDAAPATGAGDDVGGTLVIAQPEPDILLPPLVAGVQGKMVTDLLFEPLAEITPALETTGDKGFMPRLATSWTWSADSMSLALAIEPRARWHDGRPVTARDVAFAFSLYKDPAVQSPLATNLANIDSVTVRDSLTAVAWFAKRTPEQFYDLVTTVVPLPEHVLRDVPRAGLATSPYARGPVGSGRFRIERWEAGQRLVVVADTAHYRGRPKLDRVVMVALTDPTAAATRLLAGEVDLLDQLRPEVLAQLAKNPDLRAVRYPGLDYAFMQFNLQDGKASRPHPIFADRQLRRALTMALDRQTMVKSVLDSLGTTAIGPVTRALSVADTTIPQLPYDTARARATLDSAGWVLPAGKQVREKAGRPLRFTLLVPGTSKNRIAFATLIQEQLRAVGVQVEIEQVDFNAFLQRESTRDFDAVLGAWHTDPTPAGVRQTWGSAGASANGSNYGMYRSAEFDMHVDSALSSFDGARAREHFHAAYRTIIEDAPAVWLYETRPTMGVHKRIRMTGIRADAWWAALGDWSIPAGERLPRDGAAVAATP